MARKLIPKIEFVHSFIYESEIYSRNFDSDMGGSIKYVDKYVKEIKKVWDPINSRVLGFISDITKLEWKRNVILCYVIKQSTLYPISDPLTIPIQHKDGKRVFTLKKDRFVDMLTHELIHNLFIQNEFTQKYFDYLVRKYKKESLNAVLHIPIHAVHKAVFLNVFNEKRLKDEISMNQFYPDYKRSWDIVEKEGHIKIIKEMVNFLK